MLRRQSRLEVSAWSISFCLENLYWYLSWHDECVISL